MNHDDEELNLVGMLFGLTGSRIGSGGGIIGWIELVWFVENLY